MIARLGLPYTVVPVDVDEAPRPGEPPARTAERLALAKASAARAKLSPAAEAVIVGADTIVVDRGHQLGKPATPDEAIAMLRRLRRKTHRVISGLAVLDARTGQTAVTTRSTRVHLRPMTDREIAAYVASGEPLAVAGAFTLDGRGGWFVDGIDGDHGNVLGISLPLLRRLLADLGFDVTELWA